MFDRRSFLAHICAGGVALTVAACGDSATPEITPAAVKAAPDAKPSGNLAQSLPAMPELRSGRTQTNEEFTENGRLDRIVYFSDVTPGHVLNYYLDEMPAIGWTETFRSNLDATGGELKYKNPGGSAELVIKVDRRSNNRSSTILELNTTLP